MEQYVEYADWMFQIIVLTVVLIATGRKIRRGERNMPLVFFAFAMASYLMSDCYWIAHTLMLPDVRVPFAADAMGDDAMCLLLAASLATSVREYKKPALWLIVGGSLFAMANAALWIAWTGKWVLDITGGLAYGYFLCVCLRTLQERDVFSRRDWITLGTLGALLVAGNTVWTFVPENTQKLMDVLNYSVIACGVLFYIIRILRLMRAEDHSGCLMPLTFAANLWCTTCLYTCDGPAYSVLSVVTTLTIPLMLLGITNEGNTA